MTSRKHISKSVRFEVLKRDGFRCVYCGKSASETPLEIDHVHPYSRGGKDVLSNYVAACKSCNIGKSDTSVVNNSQYVSIDEAVRISGKSLRTLYRLVAKTIRDEGQDTDSIRRDIVNGKRVTLISQDVLARNVRGYKVNEPNVLGDREMFVRILETQREAIFQLLEQQNELMRWLGKNF